nr:hypothetical protein [Pegethrix bostrychoides GSE-TBD4-15B]
PTVWFKPPWELLYTRSRTPETLKAVQVALVKPVAYLLSYRQVINRFKIGLDYVTNFRGNDRMTGGNPSDRPLLKQVGKSNASHPVIQSDITSDSTG